jgi:hypothetical protein
MEKNNFPKLTNVQQIKTALKTLSKSEKNSFYEMEKEGLIYYNYRYFHKNTFPDPKEANISETEVENRKVLRECRGIVFDSYTKKCVSRSLHKFFNLNGPLKECKFKLII